MCLAPKGFGEPVKATESASSKGLICAIDGDCTGLETEQHSGQGASGPQYIPAAREM